MKNLTDITVILDRSGSMHSIREATITSFNKFLREQREVAGDAVLSLVQFDDQYEPNYTASPLAVAAELTTDTFVPRGVTALYDAIARTVDDIGARLRALPETERPDKVIIVIVTDGLENASKTFSSVDVRNRVQHQSDAYNWKFIFLGANQDAILTGSHIGIPKDWSLTFAASKQGVHNSTEAYSNTVTHYRSNNVLRSFSTQDRQDSLAKS